MEQRTSTILAVDDDPIGLKILMRMLGSAGYNVIGLTGGEQVLDQVDKGIPDLFLLDIMMPVMDGLEVCRRLKQDERVCRVPVVFITGKDETDDVVDGFNVGAADYVTKPVNKAELLARVRTHVQLYHSMLELERLRQLALDANPLTGLPGNNSVVETITRAINEKRASSVIYCDLDNFKAYNDKYGFARGDQAIRYTSSVILEVVARRCPEDHFVGHIGGDDFTLVVPAERAQEVAEEIGVTFDEGVAALYDPEDRAEGGILSVNRQGEAQRFPLMTLSMGGVDLSVRHFDHYLEVANLCAEVKKFAKKIEGSKVYFDRRSG